MMVDGGKDYGCELIDNNDLSCIILNVIILFFALVQSNGEHYIVRLNVACRGWKINGESGDE